MAVLPLPGIGTWLFRRGDSDRKRVAAENPVAIVKQLDGHIKTLKLKQPDPSHSHSALKDADKDALVGAMLLMGKSLQDALNMFISEVLPHDEYPKGWNEVLSGTLGGLHRALTDTLVTLERPSAEVGLSMKQQQESLKTRTLSLELDEAPVKPRLNRSESAPAATVQGEISPDFPPLGPPLRLAPVPERFEPAYEYRDLAAENPGVSIAVIQELRAEMRVNAAIQLAIESLEFTEGQLQLVKQVNKAAGGAGANLEPVQQHFYEGYDRILRRAVELERRDCSSEVPVPVQQQSRNENRPQTSHTQSSAQLSPTSWKPRAPRRISLVTIPPPHEEEALARGQRRGSHTQKRPGTAPNGSGGMMHRKRSIMFNDDEFSDHSTLGNSRSYSTLRGSHGSRGSMEAMTMSPTGQAFDQSARARANVRRNTVHGMGGIGIREEDERPQPHGLSKSQQLQPSNQQPTLRRRLSLAEELAMAGNTDSDSSNYGDEVDYDYDDEDNDHSYQEDDNEDHEGHQDDEEEDEEFGEFGEVGEASVIQSELGSGSDRDLASPRTPAYGPGGGLSPGVGPGGPGGFVHGMVHGGLGLAAAAGNGDHHDLNHMQHSRMSSLDSIPMSEGIVGQIPPSEYGSQFDGEGSTYGGGGRGYGWAHSRQISNVSTTFDDRISYVPSTQWGNVESVEEGYEGEEEEYEHHQQQGQQQGREGDEEEEEEEEELKGPGGRPLSGYFPGAGRYDGEYDDDREYGDDMDDEEGDGYADEDEGMEGGDHDDEGSGGSVDENEELTEIIEQLRPYMMLGGATGNTGNTGRISA